MVFVKGDLWWASFFLSEFKAFIFSSRFKKLSFFLSTLVHRVNLSAVQDKKERRDPKKAEDGKRIVPR